MFPARRPAPASSPFDICSQATSQVPFHRRALDGPQSCSLCTSAVSRLAWPIASPANLKMQCRFHCLLIRIVTETKTEINVRFPHDAATGRAFLYLGSVRPIKYLRIPNDSNFTDDEARKMAKWNTVAGTRGGYKMVGDMPKRKDATLCLAPLTRKPTLWTARYWP